MTRNCFPFSSWKAQTSSSGGRSGWRWSAWQNAWRSLHPPLPSHRSEKGRPLEDIRASKTYIVRRAAKDKIAQKKALLDSINEFGNILSQYDMPEDERTRLIHELVQELLEEETQSKTIQ